VGSLWLTLLARPYTSGCARTLERGVSKRRVGSPAVIGMELPESLAVIGMELPESLAVIGMELPESPLSPGPVLWLGVK